MAVQVHWPSLLRGAAYGLARNIATYAAGGLSAALLFTWTVPRKEALAMCLAGAFMTYAIKVLVGGVQGFIKGYRASTQEKHRHLVDAHRALVDLSVQGTPEEDEDPGFDPALIPMMSEGQAGFAIIEPDDLSEHMGLHVFSHGRSHGVFLSERDLRNLAAEASRAADHIAPNRQP